MPSEFSSTAIVRQGIARIVVQVLSLVVMAVVGYTLNHLAARHGKDNDDSATTFSSHSKTVRGWVTTPESSTGPTLDAIGGYAAVKRDLQRMVVFPLKHPHIFYDPKAPALRPPCGVLLTGPPGTGKTLLARACAKESGANFMALHSAALESKWWGESPKLLQTAFRTARTTLSPCIIFFDEIDGLGRSRNEQDQSCVYSFKCELLRNMDGIDKNTDAAVTVLGCTNCPTSLDPALRRRFTRQIQVDLPDEDERRDILRVVCHKEPSVNDALLASLAKHTEGFTGADLSAAYVEACGQRVWDERGDDEQDLSAYRDGSEFLTAMGPLTRENWTHSGRIHLPAADRQYATGQDASASVSSEDDAPRAKEVDRDGVRGRARRR